MQDAMIPVMRRLPNALYLGTEVRELDRIAIEEFNIPGATLMTNAGMAAFAMMREHWPRARKLVVVVGTGNNGGDGFVLARLAHEASYNVKVIQVGDPAKIKGDALTMAEQWVAAGGVTEAFSSGLDLGGAEVVVDALLGIGLNDEVKGDWAEAICAINDSHAKILALDVPSGLDADCGLKLGYAVNAHMTMSFIGLKRGLFTGAGPRHAGHIEYADLRIPPQVLMRVQPSCSRMSLSALAHLLAPRLGDIHKGKCGHVLVVGGDTGMSGAVRLAAEAAARVGAGLVSVATRPEHAVAISSTRPELMCHGVETAIQLRPLLKKATVVVIGPGLGQTKWATSLLGEVLDHDLPMVIDADALNLLVKEPHQRDNWILTPHPGEAARLLSVETKAIQANRFAAVRNLQRMYGGVAVLKGAGTLVSATDMPLGLCAEGNPGMASGGMGDVLTGVIAGLLAQRRNPRKALPLAARLGVCVHARAGDQAAKEGGERGLLASDLMPMLQEIVNPVQFG